MARKKKNKVTKGEVLLYGIAVISFIMMLGLKIFCGASIGEMKMGIEETKYKIDNQQKKNESLTMKVNELTSFENVKKVVEEMGLAYSVYSYSSAYKDQGVIEFYAGVNPTSRDKTVEEMIKVINTFTKDGVTEKELLRGKEQMKSSLIMGRESTSSQMLTFGKYLLLYDQVFNIEERMQKINELKVDYVNKVIKEVFKLDKVCAATVGPKRKPVELSI